MKLFSMQIHSEDAEYCSQMLGQVSRTFAPTIRMLPKRLFLPVTVAYLLCRIADTVEDEVTIATEDKENLLLTYADIFKQGDAVHKENFLQGVAVIPDHNADVELTKNLTRVLNVYNTFHPEVQKMISTWVIEMTMGMKKYAQSSAQRKKQFLKSMKELDEYMYYVAGTVGHMLTSLFTYFSKKITPAISKKLEIFSESFGKGLQLVNIIRDMAGDLKRGQSYIPDEILHKYALTRQSIFESNNRGNAEQLFDELIETAVDHLDQALVYILNIPKEETRIRIFCLLPLFWAMQTLSVIHENSLNLLQAEKVKISRKVIRTEFYKTLVLTFSNRLTVRHYNKIRKNMALAPLNPLFAQ
jgi:farnesyl-diphosphate farnesyltransferase